jgi:ammonia channel protein AmtB
MCMALDELLLAARRFATEMQDSRIGLTMAASGAVRGLAGLAPTSAYIAAHAALRLDGPAAYAAERAWQVQWLVDRLSLRADL